MIDQEPTIERGVRGGRSHTPTAEPGRPTGDAASAASPGMTRSVSDSAPDVAVIDTFGSVPIGAYLKRQRTLRGVTIEELSAQTRIPLRSLGRLESGEFDGETDGFVRGFVRPVADALGLDVDDTVSRMLKEPTPGVWERQSSGRRLKQGIVIFGLVVLGTVGFLILQAGWGLLVGATSEDPDRALVVWRDPVRALAEASGEVVDPAGEIDPSRGSRVAPVLADSVPRP